MSFKRTSCALNGQTMNTELNTCDVICLGRTNSEEENASPSDAQDDIPVETFHPCFPPNTTEEQLTSFLSSTSSQSTSTVSNFVSVQEVGPSKKLVARDGSFALKNSRTFQDKHLLASRESGSTNLDLRSERNIEIDIDNEQENIKKDVENDCDRCHELQRISERKDAKISELTKKLNELTEKHKMFILSNCQLNEENDCLKIQNQQFKLKISKFTFENSQLRSENDNLLKQFAAKENQWLEKSRVSSSSSCVMNPDSSHPNPSNPFTSVIRDDLQEAILLSSQQKSDVWGLQEKITHQNELIKTLCSQLEKIKRSGRQSLLKEHSQGVPQQEKSPYALQKQLLSNRFSTAVTGQDDATQVSQVGVAEDNGVLLARDIASDEDLYSRGVTFYAPATSSWTKTQQNDHGVTTNSTFQSQKKAVENRKAQVQPFKFDVNMEHNIQESSSNWDLNHASIGVASPTDNDASKAQVPCVQKRLLCTEIVACPFCGQEFLGSSADFPLNFETHIATCTGLDRQCPMCLKALPGLSQTEFEHHVNDHFVPDFEVLAP